MIQLTVTDALQNFTNDYIFHSQEDIVVALSMLLDFANYGEESIKHGELRLRVRSDRPLDISKPYYHFKKERMKSK